jgi:hypothetical protein
MAATAKNIWRGGVGSAYASLDDITFDASQPTAGYSMAGLIGLQTILGSTPMGGNSGALGYEVFYTSPVSPATAGNLFVYQSGGSGSPLTQVATGVTLAALTVRMFSIGY